MAKKTLRAQCLEAAQLLARIAAADDSGYSQCASCGTTQHYKEMDGGHYIAKGKSSYWALDPVNIHPQCKSCNGFGMKYGNAESLYTLWMIDMYGRDFVEHMHDTTKKVKKMYKADYEEFLAEVNGLIKYHRDRIGEL